MRWMLLTISLAATLACASTPPLRFDGVPAAPPGDPYPNWDHPPIVTLEEMKALDRTELKLLSDEGAGAGVTGARKVDAYVPEFDEDVRLKVKRMPSSLDGWNNSPRKEMAAYRLQELFLDPVDFVVPTTAPRCVPLDDEFSLARGWTSPSVKGTNCVLVAVAAWMKDVTLPSPLYEPERFASEGRYAYHLANFNILTYLVTHRDNRQGNFLVSKNEADRRVFAIDNGTTFGAWWFNWFYPPTYAWRNIQVPALPRKTVDRLRELTFEDLERELAVLVQLEADEAGILRIVAPTEPFDPEEGVRVEGTTVQFGLTDEEIEELWELIGELLEEVDEGDIALF